MVEGSTDDMTRFIPFEHNGDCLVDDVWDNVPVLVLPFDAEG